jgi:predicted dehydrogenase
MIQAAVIGVGAMGRNHARVYHEMPETELAAVADLESSRRWCRWPCRRRCIAR